MPLAASCFALAAATAAGEKGSESDIAPNAGRLSGDPAAKRLIWYGSRGRQHSGH